MKYMKQYKVPDAQAQEITKEEAKRILEGWWIQEALDDAFDNDLHFRLWTPYSVLWTETEDGRVPMAGFYGIIG